VKQTHQMLAAAGLLLLLTFTAGKTPSRTLPEKLPYRWFFCFGYSLGREEDVNTIVRLLHMAARSGLNGMVWEGGLDSLAGDDPGRMASIRRIKRVADSLGIELIPALFSAGYGGAVLKFNPDLAAGLPVRDILYVAGTEAAFHQPDTSVQIRNGGFEIWQGYRAAGYQYQDRPGQVTFPDFAVRHRGRASLRFEHFGRFPGGRARILRRISVRPYRCYRISFWIRTRNFYPSRSFSILLAKEDGTLLGHYSREIGLNQEWTRMTLGFNSLANRFVDLTIGIWEGRSGTVWIDDLEIEEVGLLNVLRRPGTPLQVKSLHSGMVYQEGVDYATVRDPQHDFQFDRPSLPIRLLPGSRIRPGEQLLVSYYHGAAIKRNQVSVCMSEPEVYRIWQQQARRIVSWLQPKKFFLNMDEIRQGGTCQACKRRGQSMAEMLADCIRRQMDILRELVPGAQFFIWSDMLDPGHNARKEYYMVEGDFSGVWNLLPKNLTIVVWGYKIRDRSIRFFSQRGYPVLAASYYDALSLDSVREWLHSLKKAARPVGIMYTSWQRKYGLLEKFGALVEHEW